MSSHNSKNLFVWIWPSVPSPKQGLLGYIKKITTVRVKHLTTEIYIFLSKIDDDGPVRTGKRHGTSYHTSKFKKYWRLRKMSVKGLECIE